MSGIYIHIPFCIKRCNYCDFYLTTNTNLINDFVSNLKKEISLSSNLYKEEPFDTIYFGGGTPSLLESNQVEEILNSLFNSFNFKKEIEISIECNPEDFAEEKFRGYKSLGINRLSFGVQSFIDDELKFLTRSHTSHQAEEVINKASEDFENINVDIIYSLPNQSIENIDYSLSKAIELNVKHISAYTLTFEDKTVLGKSLKKNIVEKNSDEYEAELFNFVSEKLTSNGFIHYEISNFAKENFQSKHNLKYWQNENYIGLGPSSHSYFNSERWNNFNSLTKYNSSLQKEILPIENKALLDESQKKLEYIMLSLRSGGINLMEYKKIFDEDLTEEYQESISYLTKNNFSKIMNGKFKLNENGFVLADEIVARYF